MSELKACRMCLVANVRMFEIQGFLQKCVSLIMGPSLLNLWDLPCYICYECAALLRKYNQFRDKCLLAQSTLYDIIQNNEEVTEYSLNTIDRSLLKLESNFKSNTKIECIGCDSCKALGSTHVVSKLEHLTILLSPLEMQLEDDIKKEIETETKHNKYDIDANFDYDEHAEEKPDVDIGIDPVENDESKLHIMQIPLPENNIDTSSDNLNDHTVKLKSSVVPVNIHRVKSSPTIKCEAAVKKKPKKLIAKKVKIDKSKKYVSKNKVTKKNKPEKVIANKLTVDKIKESGNIKKGVKYRPDKDTVQEAVKAVRAGLMSQRAAVKQFGVTRSTLYRTLHNISFKKPKELLKQRSKTNKEKGKRNKKETGKLKKYYEEIRETYLKDFEVIKYTLEEQLAEFEKRKDSSNYKDAVYRCDLCYKGFNMPNTYKNHMKMHDERAGHVKCAVCSLRFRAPRHYTRHAGLHSTRYRCKLCGETVLCLEQMKRHKKWHDGVTYPCKICGEVFQKYTSHLSHVRKKHPSDHVCDQCGYSFVSYKGLLMHKKRTHMDFVQDSAVDGKENACLGAGDEGEVQGDGEGDGGDETELYCEECDIKFSCVAARRRHEAVSSKHTSSTSVMRTCPYCGELFADASELRHHARTHAAHARYNALKRRAERARVLHLAPAAYPHPCTRCGEMMVTQQHHYRHMSTRHAERRAAANPAAAPTRALPAARSRGAPQRHVAAVCELCGKVYKNNTLMMYHRATHFPDRKFKCTMCPKAFHLKGNLNLHLKTHSDERMVCGVCSKVFKTKLGLKEHTLSHTDSSERPTCLTCGKVFSRKSYLNLHIKNKHMAVELPMQKYKKRRPRKPRPDTVDIEMKCMEIM